jgi:hypothetical protein
LQLDPHARTLQAVEWPAEFAPVKEAIESRLDRSSRQRGGAPREALNNRTPVFIVPSMPDVSRNGFGRGGFDPRNGFGRGDSGSRSAGRVPGPGPAPGPGPK